MQHFRSDTTPAAQAALLGAAVSLGDLEGQITGAHFGPIAAFAQAQLAQSGKLAGAFPFDRAADGVLYDLAPAAPAHAAPASSGTPARTLDLSRTPRPETYGAHVARLAALLGDPANLLDKVVLARMLEYATDRDIDLQAVAQRLAADPHVTRYCLPLPSDSAQPTWLVGATPELLLAKQGARIRSHPLAGSTKRQPDALRDKQAARALLTSQKDVREHRIVVEYIHDLLAPYCRQLEVPATPQLDQTATMWHLGTEIAGDLRDADTPCLELVRILHPTPAVAGRPLAPALEQIAQCEPFDRGYYAGTLGHLDGRNNGAWYVTLRCAVVQGARARLYAGAGIIAQSDPATEIAETKAKFAAMRAALGIHERH